MLAGEGDHEAGALIGDFLSGFASVTREQVIAFVEQQTP
jgi:hypothetical protein